jgi:sec-independent protein translocase protein TatA
MIGKLGVPELIVVLVLVVLLFGPSRLGAIGKSLGEAVRNFRSSPSDHT